MPTRSTQKVVDLLKQELSTARQELTAYIEAAEEAPEAEPGEGASGYESWFAAVNLQRHMEHQVEEIEGALLRAEAGSYGVCETCGELIGADRLHVLPFATQCIACASKAVPED